MAKANGIIGSLLWKSGERIMVQGIGLLVQIILARLLMPEDFASLAIITAIVNYLGIFVQCGLSAAVVQKKDLSEIDVSTLTTLSLLVALILYVGLFLMAPVINSWYNMEELVWPIRVMGIALFLYSFNSIQSGLLQRKMMFACHSYISGHRYNYGLFRVWSMGTYLLRLVEYSGNSHIYEYASRNTFEAWILKTKRKSIVLFQP